MVKRSKAGRFVSDLQDRIDQLRSAGFSLGYVHPDDVAMTSIPSWKIDFEYYRGSRIRYVTDDPCEDGSVPFVYFGDVAAEDEGVEQCDTARRSNFRVLVRQNEYHAPDLGRPLFVRVGYGRTETLGSFVADLSDEVIAMMVGLKQEYAVLDESDLSELESEEIHASWDDFLKHDLWWDMSEPLRSIWDALGEQRVQELFWRAVSDDQFGCYPEHSGGEVLWGDRKALLATFRPILIRAYWDARKGCSLCGSDSDECMQGCKYVEDILKLKVHVNDGEIFPGIEE